MQHDILIVDDEAPVWKALCAYFRRRGFAARGAESIAQVWHELEQRRPSIIILDLALGEEDGLVLLEEIRASDAAPPVVIFTGLGFDDELIDEALKKGAAGYVSKGLSLDHLLMEVHRVLQIHPK
jgi:DNA-binding response OmpR family regulator